MIIDHIGFYFLQDYAAFRLLGRGAAPLFFFLIGYEGRLRITPLLLFYGLTLSLSAYVVNGFHQINILLSFVLIHYLMHFFHIERAHTFTRILCFLALSFLNFFIYNYIEYGLLGILIAYCGRLMALHDKQGPTWLMLVLLVYFIWECIYFQFQQQPLLIYSFAGLVLCLYFMMSQYQLKTLSCPSWLLVPALVISRYSLEIYFYHLILFQAYRFLHLGQYFVQ